jgi:hypothetical protein
MIRAPECYPEVPPAIKESVQRARAIAPLPPPEVDPVLAYLSCVYREVMKWKKRPPMLLGGVQSYYEKHFHGRILQSYFRFLIELSAGAHVSLQEKSKYTMVLEFAQKCAVSPNEFEDFVNEREGIKGCIREAKASRKKAKGRRSS